MNSTPRSKQVNESLIQKTIFVLTFIGKTILFLDKSFYGDQSTWGTCQQLVTNQRAARVRDWWSNNTQHVSETNAQATQSTCQRERRLSEEARWLLFALLSVTCTCPNTPLCMVPWWPPHHP